MRTFELLVFYARMIDNYIEVVGVVNSRSHAGLINQIIVDLSAGNTCNFVHQARNWQIVDSEMSTTT